MVGNKHPRGIAVRASTLKGFSYQVKLGRHVQRIKCNIPTSRYTYCLPTSIFYCYAAAAAWLTKQLTDSCVRLRQYCFVAQSYSLPIEDLIKAQHFDKSQGSGSILSGTPAESTMAHLTTTRFTPGGIPSGIPHGFHTHARCRSERCLPSHRITPNSS